MDFRLLILCWLALILLPNSIWVLVPVCAYAVIYMIGMLWKIIVSLHPTARVIFGLKLIKGYLQSKHDNVSFVFFGFAAIMFFFQAHFGYLVYLHIDPLLSYIYGTILFCYWLSIFSWVKEVNSHDSVK